MGLLYCLDHNSTMVVRGIWCIALLLALHLLLTSGCYIHGTDSGECEERGTQPGWRITNMPYCAKAVNYPVCVPRPTTLPPSREFPNGRWGEYLTKTKDDWVRDNIFNFVQERIGFEKNKTLKRKRQNEYGEPHRITTRFHKKPDCLNAYTNYFCWINFPRCDPLRDLSFPTCRSSCENFFKSCGYERDLWRCGKSMYFNGYEPETPKKDSVSGEVSYLREYFPGQPFRENKYTTGGSELAICTPAITGAAARSSSNSLRMGSLALLIAGVSVLLSVMY